MSNKGDKPLLSTSSVEDVKRITMEAIDRCDNVDKLLDLIERVKQNKTYSKEVKEDIVKHANSRASILADLKCVEN